MSNSKLFMNLKMWPFKSKSIPLTEQLNKLSELGLTLSAGANTEDLYIFETREELETEAYKGIIEALGYEIERSPYTPVCNKLWMCDYERIEDHGAYVDVIKRLELMTDKALKLSEIKDYVDVEEGKAWVEFICEGKRIHWDADVDNDWLDPYIITKYDALLKEKQIDMRIYSNHTDYGQVGFFGAFTYEQYKVFSKLSKVKLILIEKQS
ncbi:MAG: hypothetical protein ACYTER_05780 [Planctomycetota bacterium]